MCLFANTEKNGKSFKEYFEIGKNTLKDRPNAIKGSCLLLVFCSHQPNFRGFGPKHPGAEAPLQLKRDRCFY